MAIGRYGNMRLRHNRLGVQVDGDVCQENEGTEIYIASYESLSSFIESPLADCRLL